MENTATAHSVDQDPSLEGALDRVDACIETLIVQYEISGESIRSCIADEMEKRRAQLETIKVAVKAKITAVFNAEKEADTKPSFFTTRQKVTHIHNGIRALNTGYVCEADCVAILPQIKAQYLAPIPTDPETQDPIETVEFGDLEGYVYCAEPDAHESFYVLSNEGGTRSKDSTISKFDKNLAKICSKKFTELCIFERNAYSHLYIDKDRVYIINNRDIFEICANTLRICSIVNYDTSLLCVDDHGPITPHMVPRDDVLYISPNKTTLIVWDRKSELAHKEICVQEKKPRRSRTLDFDVSENFVAVANGWELHVYNRQTLSFKFKFTMMADDIRDIKFDKFENVFVCGAYAIILYDIFTRTYLGGNHRQWRPRPFLWRGRYWTVSTCSVRIWPLRLTNSNPDDWMKFEFADERLALSSDSTNSSGTLKRANDTEHPNKAKESEKGEEVVGPKAKRARTASAESASTEKDSSN